MSPKARTSYQHQGGLQEALVDLIRVGVAGYGPGVRQIASRLLRALPPEVESDESFRAMLRDAMSASPATNALRFAPGEMPQDAETNPLVDVDPTPSGAGLVLAPKAMEELNEIVEERDHIDKLQLAGVAPTRTLLLSGPPGVGKSLAARWLAEHIDLPLVSLDLASVVSSYLGSSGRNIKSVLHYAQTGPCVLLLDEFDAVAKRRDDDTDIGELKRIVNVLLVELDRWSETSLLVAATNHPQLLDPAIGRRFDRWIDLALPGPQERRLILGHLANDQSDSTVLDIVSDLLDGVSGSEIVRVWELAKRRSILRGSSIDDELLEEVLWRHTEPGPVRDRAWLLASSRLGLSARQIAHRAHVTHPTVSAALRRQKELTNG